MRRRVRAVRAASAVRRFSSVCSSLISPHPRRPRTPAPLFPSRAPAAGRPSNVIDGFLNSAVGLVFLSLPSARRSRYRILLLSFNFCFLEE